MKKPKTRKAIKRATQKGKIKQYANGADDHQEYIVKNCQELVDVCPDVSGVEMLAAIKLAGTKKNRSDKVL